MMLNQTEERDDDDESNRGRDDDDESNRGKRR